MSQRKGMPIDRRSDEPIKNEAVVQPEFVNCFRHGQREVITGNTETGVLDCGHVYVFANKERMGMALIPPYRFPAVSMS